ncbi:MAG: hypothetical protein H6631_06405 [Anaerolineaceae bacterium]|nr:hypothetical protein [Anaerolineaceae bacterium]MCB9101804.1 hypothetical protein [Anaerolineales bacterium]
MPGMTKDQKETIHQAEQLAHKSQNNPDMAAAMATYGYNEERWAEGEALIEAAKAAAGNNKLAYSAKLGATDAFGQSYDHTWEQCQELADICIDLFKTQTESLAALGLHRQRSQTTGQSRLTRPRKTASFAEFQAWSRNLYHVALTHPDIAPVLNNYGYPTDRLTQEAADVEATIEANHVQEQAKETALQSTVDRDHAFARLNIWYRRAQQFADKAEKRLKKRPAVEVTL